jgi:hypothetical protein
MAWCRLAAPPALERVGAWAKELGARREFCQRCKHPLAELLPLQHGGRVEASQEVRQPVAAAFDQSVERLRHFCALLLQEAWMLYMALMGEHLQVTEPLGTPRAFSHGEPSEG